IRSLAFLRILSGGRVSRDSAVRAGAPLGRVRRHSRREHSLYLWAAALELLLVAQRGRGPDVRGHLRDWSVLWRALPEIGQSLDSGRHPRHRERIYCRKSVEAVSARTRPKQVTCDV